MKESVPAGEGQELKGGKPRILVVDDSQDTRELFDVILSSAGYDVSTAESAAEALGAAEQARFDLIISDIGMPGMSGYGLAKELRSLPEYRAIPMIAITGFAEFADRQTAIWAGFDEHLHKPVEPAKLLEIARRLTGFGK